MGIADHHTLSAGGLLLTCTQPRQSEDVPHTQKLHAVEAIEIAEQRGRHVLQQPSRKDEVDTRRWQTRTVSR
jgi:hypothetical protein